MEVWAFGQASGANLGKRLAALNLLAHLDIDGGEVGIGREDTEAVVEDDDSPSELHLVDQRHFPASRCQHGTTRRCGEVCPTVMTLKWSTVIGADLTELGDDLSLDGQRKGSIPEAWLCHGGIDRSKPGILGSTHLRPQQRGKLG